MQTRYLFVAGQKILDLDAKIAIVEVGSSARAKWQLTKLLDYCRQHNFVFTKYTESVSELLYQRAQLMYPGSLHALLLMDVSTYKLSDFISSIKDYSFFCNIQQRITNKHILSLLTKIDMTVYFRQKTNKSLVPTFKRKNLSSLSLEEVGLGVALLISSFLLQIVFG